MNHSGWTEHEAVRYRVEGGGTTCREKVTCTGWGERSWYGIWWGIRGCIGLKGSGCGPGLGGWGISLAHEDMAI